MPKGIRANQDAQQAKRRQQLFARVLGEVRYASELKPHFTIDIETIRRIAKPNGTKSPHVSTDDDMAKYLKVLPESYAQYLEGLITIDELWTKRGENVPKYSPNKLSIESIQGLIMLLNSLERMSLLQWLLKLVSSESEPVPLPVKTIALSPLAIDRVRSLFKFSLLADDKSASDLNLDTGFVDWITKGTLNMQFPESIWIQVLPYLYKATDWIKTDSGIKPRLDYSQTYKNNLYLLLTDLESENIVTYQESDS